jgi:hypothetical protein
MPTTSVTANFIVDWERVREYNLFGCDARIASLQKAAPGNSWSWQGGYWNHQPQTEIELLRRGITS